MMEIRLLETVHGIGKGKERTLSNGVSLQQRLRMVSLKSRTAGLHVPVSASLIVFVQITSSLYPIPCPLSPIKL